MYFTFCLNSHYHNESRHYIVIIFIYLIPFILKGDSLDSHHYKTIMSFYLGQYKQKLQIPPCCINAQIWGLTDFSRHRKVAVCQFDLSYLLTVKFVFFTVLWCIVLSLCWMSTSLTQTWCLLSFLFDSDKQTFWWTCWEFWLATASRSKNSNCSSACWEEMEDCG